MKTSNAFVCALFLGVAALGSVPSVDAQMARKEDRQDRKRDKATKAVARYPNAERQEPNRGTSKIAPAFKKLIDLVNDKKYDETLVAAEAILANPKANTYERSIAAQAIAYSWMEKDNGNYANAIKYLEMALAENGLDNNAHYEMMYRLAQVHIQEEHYDKGLALLEQFSKETKSSKPEAYVLQANAFYRMERFEDAIATIKKAMAGNPNPDKVLNQLLMASYFELDRPLEAAKVAEEIAARSPDDKVAQINLANIYMQADQMAKAAAVFDRLRAAGKLTESKDYETGYKLLANIDGREKDAISLINEGLEKGLLKPTFEVYNFLGQSLYFSDQIPQAIVAWTKAAPLDKDGETYLNLAKVLVQEDKRDADAKANARLALAKGVKKPGDAWMVIARAEQSLGNQAAMLAAYREAAKYPETRDQANKVLRKASGK